MKLAENIHGTGARKARRDVRDFKASRLLIGRAPLPFLWSSGFDIEAKMGQILPTENQWTSFSCWGQAVRYYAEAIKCLLDKTFTRYSAHDPYCQVFYPGGGTDIRTGAKQFVQIGIKTEAIVPSYKPDGTTDEPFMQNKTLSKNSPNAPKFKEFGFAFPNTDIESIACAIRDNNGAILQVSGKNNGTWRSAYPTPEIKPEWSHFLYAGKAKVMNGIRYIGGKNAWGDIGENGWQWLHEDFFKKGLVTSAVVFFDKDLYQYPTSTLQSLTPTWLQKFLNFFLNYF